VRRDLCAEAVRLATVLAQLMPDEAEVLGLLALMLLHDARREARVGADGGMILLEDQDRGRWDRARIDEGRELLDRALRMKRVGSNQIQAAIAALHDDAATADETDWGEIAALYGVLGRMAPSPVIELNRAVAVAMASGPEAGLRLVDAVGASGQLDDYPYLHASRADLLRRLGRMEEAAAAYRRARALTSNAAEQAFLARRLAQVSGG
jgi:RNA polymerase sigma-70 factor (ECF subfamily)